jgi:hypothetical protein
LVLEDIIPCWLREACRLSLFPDYLNSQLPEESKLYKSAANNNVQKMQQLQIQGNMQTATSVIPFIISIRASEEQLMILRWQLVERISQLTQVEANALYEIAGTLIQQREFLNNPYQSFDNNSHLNNNRTPSISINPLPQLKNGMQ